MKAQNPSPCIFCEEKEDRSCFRDGSFDPDWLAEAYLAGFDANYSNSPNPALAKELEWAFDCLADLEYEAPKTAFQVVLLAMNRLQTIEQASFLAAGPLEDLIASYGNDFIDEIEIIAQQSPRFRFILSGVWSQGTENTEVWKRVQRACRNGPNIDAGHTLPHQMVRDIPFDNLYWLWISL